MDSSQRSLLIQQLITAISNRVPAYLKNPDDYNIGQGHMALCIIDAEGAIYGQMYGTDKNRMREAFRVASKKATQVWITGIATQQYEKMVYGGEIDPNQFGIMHPDFIGWEGGQPFALDKETRLAVGFSGMRGINDLEIVVKAAEEVVPGFKK